MGSGLELKFSRSSCSLWSDSHLIARTIHGSLLLSIARSSVDGACGRTRRQFHCDNEFQQLAKKYNVVLPISLFERCNNVLYNTVVMIDADGSNLGILSYVHDSVFCNGIYVRSAFLFTYSSC